MLKVIGKVLRNSAQRNEDYCFRLGGEEFGVVFSSEDKQSAIGFSRLIKDNIERLHIPHKKNIASEYVTVSMGLFCKKHDKEIDINQVYKHADKLLYQAKKAGRNTLQIDSDTMHCEQMNYG